MGVTGCTGPDGVELGRGVREGGKKGEKVRREKGRKRKEELRFKCGSSSGAIWDGVASSVVSALWFSAEYWLALVC